MNLNIIKTVCLEQIADEKYRMIILIIDNDNDNELIDNIYESEDLGILNLVLSTKHNNVEAVKTIGSDIFYSDCLSVFEAAESMMIDKRT